VSGREQIDFEREGLLTGLSGPDREARLALLEELAAEGFSLEEIEAASAAGRLALLPVERALSVDGPRYTARELAAEVGVEIEFLQRTIGALGVPIPDPDERSLTNEDLEAARRARAFREAGLPEDGMLQVARTIGMATARIAEANRTLIFRTVLRPDDNERDFAVRLATAAEGLVPLVGPTLAYALRIHLLDQVRRDVIGSGRFEAGEIGGATEVSVCFADLVGFTKLGERIGSEELAGVAGRLEQIAGAIAVPPVRLVKMIGDAAMLVCKDPAATLDAALRLVEAADQEGEQFPQLRAGVARGPALPQAGDWYGRPVNLASRITGFARPGSVLASEAARDAARESAGAGEQFHYSFAGERRLKGIDAPVSLFRVRREPRES
jgi:adenylate cyclase